MPPASIIAPAAKVTIEITIIKVIILIKDQIRTVP